MDWNSNTQKLLALKKKKFAKAKPKIPAPSIPEISSPVIEPEVEKTIDPPKVSIDLFNNNQINENAQSNNILIDDNSQNQGGDMSRNFSQNTFQNVVSNKQSAQIFEYNNEVKPENFDFFGNIEAQFDEGPKGINFDGLQPVEIDSPQHHLSSINHFFEKTEDQTVPNPRHHQSIDINHSKQIEMNDLEVDQIPKSGSKESNIQNTGSNMLMNNFMIDSAPSHKKNMESNFGRNPHMFSTGFETTSNTRDVNFLMERYKEDNNGVSTTDIVMLFSYWQTNYGPNQTSTLNLKSTIHDEKTLINYNSKSFNNKTYFGHEQTQEIVEQARQESLEPSPIGHAEIEEGENFLDQVTRNNYEDSKKQFDTNQQTSLDFGYNSSKVPHVLNMEEQKDDKELPKNDHNDFENAGPNNMQMQISAISNMSQIDKEPRDRKRKVSLGFHDQADSILFTQKMKLDKDRNNNEIRLSNVKNQIFLNNLPGSVISKKTNNFYGGSLTNISQLSGVDRNQLSIEFMNITPIMEEKEAGILDENNIKKPTEFKIEEEHKVEINDNQFSFDKELNFNPEPYQSTSNHVSHSQVEEDEQINNFSDIMEMDQDEKSLVDDLEKIDERFGGVQNQPVGDRKRKNRKSRLKDKMNQQQFIDYNNFQTMSPGNGELWSYVPNLFLGHAILQRQPGATGTDSIDLKKKNIIQYMARQKYKQNLYLVTQNYKYYWAFMLRNRSIQMNHGNLQLLRMSENVYFLYNLQEIKLSTQGYQSNDPKSLKHLELSPIIDKKYGLMRFDQKKDEEQQYSLLGHTLQGTQIYTLSTLKSQNYQCQLRWLHMSNLNSKDAVSKYLLNRELTNQKLKFKEQSETEAPQGAFDHLSSIDNGYDQDSNEGDEQGGDVLQALQDQSQISGLLQAKDSLAERGRELQSAAWRENKLKNDDEEYKKREIRNLNKFRDRSHISNNSDMPTHLGLTSLKGGQANISDVGDILDRGQTARKHHRKHHHSKQSRRKDDRSQKRDDKDKSKHKKRKKSKYGGDSSQKSKSKSRFSNNLGFTQFQNAENLENTQDIEKLLEEIDNEKNGLEQFISKEEENYSKNFNNKVNEAERVLQNSRRDGSIRDRGADSYRAMLTTGNLGPRDASQGNNYQQNQHHNSISNNSGSFYFNVSKKVNVNQKSNNVSINNINHPYNPVGSSNQRDASVGLGQNPGYSSGSNSSSNSRSRSPNDGEDFKNASQNQIYGNSQLLTDRPNLGKKLDFRSRFAAGSNNPVGDKSNERHVSVISGNSNGQKFGTGINNNQYSSLSRVGIQKISSGYSNGGYSNQSPSNQNQNFLSQQKLLTQKNPSTTQNSYRTLNIHNQQQSHAAQPHQNPVLLKLQTTQMTRLSTNQQPQDRQTMAGKQSMLISTNSNNDYPLSHRALTGSAIQTIITPKSHLAGQTTGGTAQKSFMFQNKSGQNTSHIMQTQQKVQQKASINLQSSDQSNIFQPESTFKDNSNILGGINEENSKIMNKQQELGGPNSSRVPKIGGFGSQSNNQHSKNLSNQHPQKLKMKSSRGQVDFGGISAISSTSNANINLNQSISKLSEKLRNSSNNSSTGSNSNGGGTKRLKLKLKPRNFNQSKDIQGQQIMTTDRTSSDNTGLGKTKSTTNPLENTEKRRARNDRNRNFQNQEKGAWQTQGGSGIPQQKPINYRQGQQQRVSMQSPKYANQNQDEIKQQYYAASNNTPDNSQQQSTPSSSLVHIMSQADYDRLIKLLCDEFKRKKGKNIREDIRKDDRMQTLVQFWKDSLSQEKILNKLHVKQNHNNTTTQQSQIINKSLTNGPGNKLSEKEKWLLAYLDGSDKSQLVNNLGKESSTRSYGELACIGKATVAKEVCRYLNLGPPDEQNTDMGDVSIDKSNNKISGDDRRATKTYQSSVSGTNSSKISPSKFNRTTATTSQRSGFQRSNQLGQQQNTTTGPYTNNTQRSINSVYSHQARPSQ